MTVPFPGCRLARARSEPLGHHGVATPIRFGACCCEWKAEEHNQTAVIRVETVDLSIVRSERPEPGIRP